MVRTYAEWLQTGDDIEAARELAAEDPAFAEEATKLGSTAARSWRRSCRCCWSRATRVTTET